MNLYAVAIALTISFGGAEPVEWQFDVNPVFYQFSELPPILPGARFPGGIAIGNYFWIDSERIDHPLDVVMREEYLHTQQHSALGPAFFPLYFASLGEPFEPYSPRAAVTGRENVYDLDAMWMPDDPMRCPMVRITSRDGFALHPCYWEFGKALYRAATDSQ